MAELNADASLVRDGSVVQVEKEMLETQNQCIFCTLWADIVVEVAKLVKQKRFDFLVIESIGISEPAFTFPFPLRQLPGLGRP